MKTTTALIAFLLLTAFTCTASTDTETKPQPDQSYPLLLLPKLEVLYFNQTIEFTLPNPSANTVDHVDFKYGTAEITPAGFKLTVDYANVEQAICGLKVYTINAGGEVTLTYEREITLLQKLNGDVADDGDLFILDYATRELNSTLSKATLLQSSKLILNATRFNAKKVTLKEFDLEISNGVKLHSPDGTITEEMKAAIRRLNDGDSFNITNVVSEYEVEGQKVKMNINYTPKVTIGNVG